MAQGDVAAQMRALAEELAADDPQLDFSLGSLKRIEEQIRRYSVRGVRMLGAYLGETIRRNSEEDSVTWIDFDAAAASGDGLEGIARDEETSAILHARSSFLGGPRFWFPLVKVAKFIHNGSQDSIAAFAGVALVRAPEPPSPRINREDFKPEARQAAEAFIASPDRDTLRDFSRFMAGRVSRADYAAFYRAFGLRAAMFTPFLDQPAQGRGYRRFDPARRAAEEIASLVEAGVEPRDEILPILQARLDDRKAKGRRAAAYVVCRVLLMAGETAQAMEVARPADVDANVGCLEALSHLAEEHVTATVLNRKGLEERPLAPIEDVSPFVPVLDAALTGKADLLKAGLDVVRTLAVRLKISVASLLPSVVRLLDHHPKPAVVEDAIDIIDAQAHLVHHGRAPYVGHLGMSVPRIVDLIHAKPGALKVTKVQVAAKYALSVLVLLRDHFDAETSSMAQQALKTSAHIR